MAEISSKVDKSSKIAVLCGGMSSEAEVSRRSGKGCYDALKRLGYNNAELVEVHAIQVGSNGKVCYVFPHSTVYREISHHVSSVGVDISHKPATMQGCISIHIAQVIALYKMTYV